MFRILIVCFVVLSTGCATTNFTPRFEQMGKLNESYVEEINKKAQDMKWAEASDIEVYIGSGPDEMVTNENGKLVYDASVWKVLGKVTVSPDVGTHFSPNYAEDENWRNIYCPINSVLLIPTLTLWALTPFAWPCMTNENNSVEMVSKRKSRIIKTLKKSAKAADGDMLIITNLGHLEFQNSDNKVIKTEEMMYAEGIVLKKIN